MQSPDKLHQLLAQIKTENSPVKERPQTSANFELVGDVVKITGTVIEHSRHYHRVEKDYRVKNIEREICLEKFYPFYFENNTVFFKNETNHMARLHLSSLLDAYFQEAEDKAFFEICKQYSQIKKKQEIARQLMIANPFFKKEELLAQVEVMYSVLGEIK